MNLSINGAKTLKNFEGCKLMPYKDAAGYWTIGIGHKFDAAKNPEYMRGITPEKCDELFRGDLQPVYRVILEHVTAKINQNQFDSIVSFVFNIGVNAFIHSTFLTMLNSGRLIGAGDEMLKWCHAGGVVNDGLLKRRTAERRLFLTPMGK